MHYIEIATDQDTKYRQKWEKVWGLLACPVAEWGMYK